MKIDTQEVKKLFGKYENDGLDIFIEFSRWDIRLRVSNGMFHLNKLLTYDMLDDLPDTITFEFIVDEFVKDLKHKLQKMQNESEEQA